MDIFIDPQEFAILQELINKGELSRTGQAHLTENSIAVDFAPGPQSLTSVLKKYTDTRGRENHPSKEGDERMDSERKEFMDAIRKEEQGGVRMSNEGDMKVLQEKRDNLVKVIEGAGFILTGIELSAMSRTPTEKPCFTFEVKGFSYGEIDSPDN